MNIIKNNVQLVGNLGNDPEIKTLDSGRKVANFSIATNESYINKEGAKVETSYWHNIVAWGKTAEIVEKYVLKGNQVIVSGKLTNRNYEDKDGVKRTVTEIVVNEVINLSPKPQAEQQNAG